MSVYFIYYFQSWLPCRHISNLQNKGLDKLKTFKIIILFFLISKQNFGLYLWQILYLNLNYFGAKWLNQPKVYQRLIDLYNGPNKLLTKNFKPQRMAMLDIHNKLKPLILANSFCLQCYSNSSFSQSFNWSFSILQSINNLIILLINLFHFKFDLAFANIIYFKHSFILA